MLSLLKPKVVLVIALVLLIGSMSLYIYKQGHEIEMLSSTITVLETEKASVENLLKISNANNMILEANQITLQHLIEKSDLECASRVARAEAKTTVLEKRTYIPISDAAKKGVLDEKSNDAVIDYLNQHIFN